MARAFVAGGVPDLNGEVVVLALQRLGKMWVYLDQGQDLVDQAAVAPQQVVDARDAQACAARQGDPLIGAGLESVGSEQGDAISDALPRARGQ